MSARPREKSLVELSVFPFPVWNPFKLEDGTDSAMERNPSKLRKKRRPTKIVSPLIEPVCGQTQLLLLEIERNGWGLVWCYSPTVSVIYRHSIGIEATVKWFDVAESAMYLWQFPGFAFWRSFSYGCLSQHSYPFSSISLVFLRQILFSEWAAR